METEADNSNILSKDNQLYSKVVELIQLARQKIATVVNLTMVHTYFEVGRMIVEDEQQGKERAEYGKAVLKDLSVRLTEKFGKGFSEQNLRNMRQFFTVYSIYETPSSKLKRNVNKSTSIRQTPSSELKVIDNQINNVFVVSVVKPTKFTLSWSHYLILMRIENSAERNFYEIEATNENWSESQLKRQYHASLYERLALSRNKKEVMKLANEGQTMLKPEDILKNPLSLEFLGMEEKVSYSESDLEHAIISKLQRFLLEMGKGFLFEARQKRFTFDGEHFFVDLVFYNRLLQCYVLIDLKIEKLTHQDLGQMQMYVNYYDRYEKQNFEKPTIGILLCKKKMNALVELTLPPDANIYAAEYSLYLPDKQLLQQKLAEWLIEFEDLE
ncbi:MAG: PDDEXK nuclease domain-containing protein [Paludibacter sp.]|nr:PDDEXK nuclease domain-containing protein [Paludibacter sp.]